MPGVREPRRKEWPKSLNDMQTDRLQEEMSNTSKGKNKLNEEQKRRDAFTARRMMSASNVPAEGSSSSRVEHERRVPPNKRARIESEDEVFNSTIMQEDTTSETNMRDSAKRQADISVEELEQNANDECNESATLNDDVEMDVQLQDEQAPGLSGIDATKVNNPAHTTSVTVTERLNGSSIMDITSACPITGTYYDFSELEDRNRAISRICSEKPQVLITSPMCTALQKLMTYSFKHTSPLERKRITYKAQRHLEFICKLIMIQHRDGRYFIHEHPSGISSWQDQSVQEVLTVTKATITEFDQCMFGLMAIDKDGSLKHYRRRSKIVSTMPAIESIFSGKLCQEEHEHAHLVEGEAHDPQSYPSQLRKAIMKAIKLQNKWDASGLKLLATVNAEGGTPAGVTSIPEEEMMNEFMEAWDDTSGESLDPVAVLAARREEITYYKEMKAFTKVPISQCIARTGRRPIGVRWIDINKGDQYNVNIRSRLVAKEFNNKKCDDLFAGTPPVEAMRAIVSMAASGTTPKTLIAVDVSRAYMYAKCRSEMYVEMCSEAYEENGDEKCCWKLEKAMYGTRSAAQDWQYEIRRKMLSMGYLQGKSSPCVFYNPSSEVACLVHGDDFLAVGEELALKQFKEQLAKDWKVKHTHIGEAEHLGKHMRVLNRIIRVHPRRGLTIEPDPRHAEILIKELDADSGRRVTTPMAKENVKESVEYVTNDIHEKTKNRRIEGNTNRTNDHDKLDDAQATKYRALVARANYLAVDRGDIAFCTKELARCMSAPSQHDWERLRRLARYLRHKSRCLLWYVYQDSASEVICFTDSDWAGCRKTRRSTSGGCILWGSHPIKVWSRTQALVSLSSAEAELYAAIKACSETLGFLSLLKDYQIHVTGKIMCDASAALGIIKRQGLGRTRHIHTSYLWIQQVNERGINFNKVSGSENCADLFTKPLPCENAEHLSEMIGLDFPGGYDEIAYTINFVGHSEQLMPPSLRSSLQNLGLRGTYCIWTRMDIKSKCFRTSLKGGPAWKDVVARVTLDASTARVIETESSTSITREREHRLLPRGPRDIVTILIWRDPTTDSGSH